MSEQPTVDRAENMIRDGRVERDATQLFESHEQSEGDEPFPPDDANWVVPLATWITHRRELRARRHFVGIQVSPDDDVSALVDDSSEGSCVWADGIAFIAIHFSVYTDGRGFSLAQLLRNQYRWTGEMRAVGDVLIDTIPYLARCGFSSFVLKEGHDPVQALRALGTFRAYYQRSYLHIAIPDA